MVGQAVNFAVFQTKIGDCAILWSEKGIVGIRLPERDEAKARELIACHYPGAVETEAPRPIRRAVVSLQRHLSGQKADFSSIELVMDGVPAFHRRVYEAARSVKAGTTVTCGELAAMIGSPGAARAVGQALGRNPFPIVVPCHRVLAAGGIGGFSATGGTDIKRKMLTIEGVALSNRVTKNGAGSFGFSIARAIRHLRGADSELSALMAAFGPFKMELQPVTSTFEALAQAIVYQQLSPRAAATIHARFCALFGQPCEPSPEGVLALEESELRSCGLSGAKAAAIRDLACRTLNGEVPGLEEARELSDDELIKRLTTVRGVGIWTAEMFLMFCLGRPDVLPLGDLGLRRGFAAAFSGGRPPSTEQLEGRADAWRPYRTVACWYLWRAAEAGRPFASTSKPD